MQRGNHKGWAVAAIGGGTGLPNVLRAAKLYASDIAAVVSVADDGGSSGRIRRDLGILPPGDIRNCLVALSAEEELIFDILQHRFEKGELAGHNLGNLILAGLTEIRGDFIQALKELSSILNIRGRVLPSTDSDVVLVAKVKNGRLIEGQSKIAKPLERGGIDWVQLEPKSPPANLEAVEAIISADQVIVGPGSLYTSIIPNLLVDGIYEAIKESRGEKIFVCNMVAQKGETTGYTASDHLEAILAHVGENPFDHMLVNLSHDKMMSDGQIPVEVGSRPAITGLGIELHLADLADDETSCHHDPAKLCQLLRSLL
ncbi:MAG: YvcK family protein [Actinomycetota bacterium]|nr:YvcK family protein [Actinomycetota bacterium]